VQRKERESNPQGRFPGSAVFETAALANGLALPAGSQSVPSVGPIHSAPAAGIEPAPSRLTAGRSYQHELHRNPRLCRILASTSWQSGRPDSNRRSPAPKAGGLPGFPTPRTDSQSAQRESNPPFRPGKAVGDHYLTGTRNAQPYCQGEHRVGLEPTSPPYESGALPLGHPCRNHHPSHLRPNRRLIDKPTCQGNHS
jgi:hypothetical protein